MCDEIVTLFRNCPWEGVVEIIQRAGFTSVAYLGFCLLGDFRGNKKLSWHDIMSYLSQGGGGKI